MTPTRQLPLVRPTLPEQLRTQPQRACGRPTNVKAAVATAQAASTATRKPDWERRLFAAVLVLTVCTACGSSGSSTAGLPPPEGTSRDTSGAIPTLGATAFDTRSGLPETTPVSDEHRNGCLTGDPWTVIGISADGRKLLLHTGSESVSGCVTPGAPSGRPRTASRSVFTASGSNTTTAQVSAPSRPCRSSSTWSDRWRPGPCRTLRSRIPADACDWAERTKAHDRMLHSGSRDADASRCT